MQNKHALAYAFPNRIDAQNCVLALEEEGIRDTDICALMPSTAIFAQGPPTLLEFEEATGGSILDPLTRVCAPGVKGLCELGLSQRDVSLLEECARRGEYVLAVKCDGTCPNVRPILTRYGDHQPNAQAHQTQSLPWERHQPRGYQATGIVLPEEYGGDIELYAEVDGEIIEIEEWQVPDW